jgi:hypothetical protein
MAWKIACALSGAGRMVSRRAKSSAALKTSVCFTATASMFEQMLVAQETEGDDEFVIVEEEGK